LLKENEALEASRNLEDGDVRAQLDEKTADHAALAAEIEAMLSNLEASTATQNDLSLGLQLSASRAESIRTTENKFLVQAAEHRTTLEEANNHSSDAGEAVRELRALFEIVTQAFVQSVQKHEPHRFALFDMM
jgi:hypothetical protein